MTNIDLTADEKFTLITRNLQEYLGGENIKKILAERDLNVYWGTAPTGKPHIGYFVPMTKIADLLRAGCHVTILFADLHAYLDNMKSSWELLTHRTNYYTALIKATLTSINVPISKLTFVTGTDYQLSRQYTLDVYRLSAVVSEHDAKKAGAEVVKQSDNAPLSGLLYPGLQALDEEYLKCDAQFGGVDQRKIFTFAEKYLPILGYKKRSHLMNVMVGGLSGSKMSSSDPDSKIDLLDDLPAITRKVRKAFCEEGNVVENPLLQFLRYVVFPIYSLAPDAPLFLIPRPEDQGGDLKYATYEELHESFKNKTLHPSDFKRGVTFALDTLLSPIRSAFSTPEMQELTALAYPPPVVQLASDISRISLRVGKILKAAIHPEADGLLVQDVDCGEELPRVIVSGIARHYTPEQVIGKHVLVVTNLKPAKLRGILSYGMLLCASLGDRVQLVHVPEGCVLGERVSFRGYEMEQEKQLNPKQKIFEKVAKEFSVKEGSACYKDVEFMTSQGACFVQGMEGAIIS